MSSYDQIADLPLKIESYELEGLEHEAPRLHAAHAPSSTSRAAARRASARTSSTTRSTTSPSRTPGRSWTSPASTRSTRFSELLEGLDLFPTPPEREVSRDYRRWAFESAALDLALRQAGTSLHEQLGREPQPAQLRRLDAARAMADRGRGARPSTIEPLRERLDVYPDLRFKLDPTNDWTTS